MLKAWNHVVYVVIPFAILGYGIGSNIQLVFQKQIEKYSPQKILFWLSFLLSTVTLVSCLLLIDLPINISDLLNVFFSSAAIGRLLLAYTVIMLPFVLIGFLIVYVFTAMPKDAHRLYFFDLTGAALGAVLFFPFIYRLGVFPTLAILCTLSFVLSLYVLRPRWRWLFIVLSCVVLVVLPKLISEPYHYVVDLKKGWEYIPGHFRSDQYSLTNTKWHPMGRTDIYRIKGEDAVNTILANSPGTFMVNIFPAPPFSYFVTNFLAGTPVYKYANLKLPNTSHKVVPFSVLMEAPYKLLKDPNVFIIGAGGGRDIFMAKAHGAKKVVGAEINPAIVSAMSSGGVMYEYSDRVYTMDDTEVHSIDGRRLVKLADQNSFDLVVLNGADTFSGLSIGAYAYAESYLYTKNALIDYLKILKDNGIVNFNRWLFVNMPRETLRLQAIAFAALRDIGAKEPWRHVIIATTQGWGMTLVKKTPFTDEEYKTMRDYFNQHETVFLYPSEKSVKLENHPLANFDVYAEYFKVGRERLFEKKYPYDISVITDDNPFFYKYYKLVSLNLKHIAAYHHTGPIIFFTQLLVVVQALLFIILFIFMPLYIFKRKNIKSLLQGKRIPLVVYFSCLGVGFMFVEISIMQKFVLLLGSPIYAISVVLATLLLTAGVGSGLVRYFKKICKTTERLMGVMTCVVGVHLLIMVLGGQIIVEALMRFPFWAIVIAVAGILCPLGIALGVFFPVGLRLVGSRFPQTIPWAWGINCGFSVLGSMLAIILAQFIGFNAILLLALVIYLIALLAVRRLVALETDD